MGAVGGGGGNGDATTAGATGGEGRKHWLRFTLCQPLFLSFAHIFLFVSVCLLQDVLYMKALRCRKNQQFAPGHAAGEGRGEKSWLLSDASRSPAHPTRVVT